MMNVPNSPFSGLSLMIHFTVIGVATLFGAVTKRDPKNQKRKLNVERTKIEQIGRTMLSLLIIVTISTLMLTFFAIAIQTGFREGSQEWHMRFIASQIQEVKNSMVLVMK